ncbi:cell wall-binding repeat-containing protein [Peptostreptococcus russellii]|uniref:cell wall-binding repeat-containing protein n=1 Tax=Peptostreptococcus russellii TaxID=215200 RepID=UPI000D0EC8B7|nr:cell wall-binding repeat-containing protein [Peptostreptococcus russellii]
MKKYSKLMAILLVFAMILAGVAQAAPVVEAEEVNSNVIRLSGADRIKTSVKISQTAYKDGAESVVIVGYEGEVDALAGTLLAHAKKGPVLFTKKGKLSEDTKTEIARLGAKNVYILGGTATIEDAVKTELETLKYTVKRISGSNREGTAAAVAKEVGGKTTHVFLARGYGDLRAVLSDALAVGPASAKGNMAVLLTRTDKVPAATLKSMKDLGVTNVTIVGGEVAVNSGVKTELETLKYTVDRLSGTTREGTAIAIANKYFAGKANALVANGYGSPDALVGGYLGAAIDAPILFSQANKVSEVTTDYLKANTEKAWILGGERVVNKEVLNKVLGAVVPTPTPPSTGGGSGGGSGDNVAVNTISVKPTELTLKVGDSGNITATVEPDNAANKNVTWSSSDTAVATVANGKVTAVAAGTVTITATAGGKTASTTVTIGDSLVEKSESIQAAIKAASAGDTILVAPGTYKEALQLNVENLTLKSLEGRDNTIIDASNEEGEAADYAVQIGSSGLGTITLEGFTVQGWKNGGINQPMRSGGENSAFHVIDNKIIAPEKSNAHGNSIQVSGNGSKVNGNIVEATTLSSNKWSASGILVVNAENVEVINNTVAGIDSAISLDGGKNGNPTREVKNVTIKGNTITGVNTGFLIGFKSNEITIKENSISDVTYGVRIEKTDTLYSDLKLETLLIPNTFPEGSVVIGNTIIVPEEGKVYNATTGDDYNTIQTAVNEAAQGDTILVAAGEHTDTIIIDRGLKLIGSKAGIEGNGTTVGYIRINTDEPVVIKNVNIASQKTKDTLIRLNGTLSNDTYNYDVRFEDCTFGSENQSTLPYRSIGLREAHYGQPGSFVVKNCTFYEATYNINLLASDNILIEGNTFNGKTNGLQYTVTEHNQNNINIKNNIFNGERNILLPTISSTAFLNESNVGIGNVIGNNFKDGARITVSVSAPSAETLTIPYNTGLGRDNFWFSSWSINDTFKPDVTGPLTEEQWKSRLVIVQGD